MKADSGKTKGQKTQERIIENALKLFGKNGFANTSMQMIANACDLSQGAVMQHFSSKNRLLEAVRRQVSFSNHEYVDSRISITDDGLTAVKKHLLYNLAWALKNPAEAQVIVLTYETAFHDTEFREVAKGAVRLGTERIYRYVLSSQREKQVDAKVDAVVAADVLHTYLVGLVVRTLATNPPTKVSKTLEDQIERVIADVLRARKQ